MKQLVRLILAITTLFITGCSEKPMTKEETAKWYIEDVLKAPLFIFRIDFERYPTTTEGLTVLVRNAELENWNGPYILEYSLVDPWEQEYKYQYPGVRNPDSYDLWSLGPDGVESDDDIGNWD